MNKNKKLKRILIDERNEFIAYNLQQAVNDENVESIVLVVGAGHVKGIIENIDNKHINIKKILSLK
jgi:pheromone shutdown protein TraB